jgi:hypothetical protein
MFMTDPIAVLESVRRALAPGGAFVAALWAEPERVEWSTWPRRVLLGHMPAIDRDAPGPFRFGDACVIERDFTRAGLAIDHLEEMYVPVFESQSAADIVEWALAFGIAKLLQDQPDERRIAWATAFERELERTRTNGWIRIGGITRVVRARAAPSAEPA